MNSRMRAAFRGSSGISFWPLESGVDVFIDNRGFAYRLPLVHESRHDTVRVQGEVLRLHLIEPEEVDIAAAPFDSFLFQRHSASHRTYGAPKVVKLNHCHPPTRLLALALCVAPASGALFPGSPTLPKAPRNSRRLHAHR